MLKFNTHSISYRHCSRIGLKSFNLYTSSQMRVPLVNCQENTCALSFSRIALSHTARITVWFLKQVTPDQIASTLTQCTTLSVALPN